MYYIPVKPEICFKVDSIYTIHQFEYHKDYTFGGEDHNFWELLYVDSGEIIVLDGESEFILRQNQLLVHVPNEFHSLRANKKDACNTVVVSFGCNFKEIDRFKDKVFYLNNHQKQMLTNIVLEAKNIYENDLGNPEYRKLNKKEKNIPYASEQMIVCLLEQLMITLLRDGGYGRKSLPKTGKTVLLSDDKFEILDKWIKENIDSSFSVMNLCSKALLNKTALEELFKEKTGMSAIEYCRYCKIEKAKKLLREDTYNVSQISEILGFSSVHYFSRTFSKLTGKAPVAYAKSKKSLRDHTEYMKNK